MPAPATMPTGPWITPGLIARLTELWNAGAVTGTIAKALNREFGLNLSRRAVDRKLQRLGLFGSHGTVCAPRPGAAIDPDAITLPSVGGSYAYRAGRLLRDGAPAEART